MCKGAYCVRFLLKIYLVGYCLNDSVEMLEEFTREYCQ